MQYKSLKKGNISKHDNDAYPENLRVLGHPGNNQTMPHKKSTNVCPSLRNPLPPLNRGGNGTEMA